jgi:predicted ribosomally synthesized peptide with SipW-like signal peptide
MRKKILFSFLAIAVSAAIVIGGTTAFFSDTEVSTGNVFTAGSIDLKVDHTKATYNGQPCVSNCIETGTTLITNGGFETPDVPSGGWAIFPDASQTSWTVESGAGLEIQDNAAGAPHGGNQLAELDSNNSSAISQTIVTVPGGKYRLHFWHSPRPNVPVGDNTIGYQIQVVSDSSVILTGTVGAGSGGTGSTVWTEYVYDFIAIDNSTKIIFTDLGNSNNSYGGYLDDISLFTLECTDGGFPYGGVCHLWNEQNLGENDQFWNFPDVKPGDHGTDVVSLHVDSNDAYACLYADNIVDTDVTLTEPETNLADTLDDGELSPYIKVFGWDDDGDGVYETGEATLITENTPLSSIATQMVALSLTGGGPTDFVGLAWCAGTQTLGAGPVINCDGTSMGDIAQTDKTTLDFTAYAVQQRNNEGFDCANVLPR